MLYIVYYKLMMSLEKLSSSAMGIILLTFFLNFVFLLVIGTNAVGGWLFGSYIVGIGFRSVFNLNAI